MNEITAAITTVGGYVPDYVLSNKELMQYVNTSDKWVYEHLGIRERRILKGEGRGTSDLCIPVAKQICEKRGIDPSEIDLLLIATSTPDMIVPNTSNIVAAAIGAKNAWAMDINLACSGFLAALDVGARFIEGGKYAKVLVIGADKMSAIVDYTERMTASIFGDGGAGVLLEPDYHGYGLIDSILKTDGEGGKYLFMPAGGSALPASETTVSARQHYIRMDGKEIYKLAVKHMVATIQELTARNDLATDDIKWLVPHQANKRIVLEVARQLSFPEEKIMINIHHYGNTTAGTIPLCLWDYQHLLKRGDKILMSAFGAGFTWGANYFIWAYDGV
jgi:3-oxoacyl-[acyl-carrier-protein] synthase-3